MSARALTESEYETLKSRAASGVRFLDNGIPAARRTTRNRPPRRKRARTSRAAGTDFILPLVGIGTVILLGTYLFGRQSGSASGMGQLPFGTANSPAQQQNAQYGAEAGAIIGQIIPIPGLGPILSEAGDLIGGLFGPGVHKTPGGETYDAATYELHRGYFAMMGLANQIRATNGLPPLPAIGFVGLGTPGCAALPDDPSTNCAQCNSINCGAVNAPLTGPYIAKITGNPAYASYIQESQMTQLQAQGAFDQAIAIQNSLIPRLQFVLESLQSGTMHWSGGQIVDTASAPLPPAPSYNSAQGQPAVIPAQGSYAATAGSAAPSINWQADGPLLAGGMLALALMFL